MADLPAAPVKEVKATVELPLLPEDAEDAEVGLAESAVEGTYPCIDAIIAPKIDASAPGAFVGLGSAYVLPPTTMTCEPTETAVPEIVVWAPWVMVTPLKTMSLLLASETAESVGNGMLYVLPPTTMAFESTEIAVPDIVV